MSIKRISIPKIPHNLRPEQVGPILSEIRQALVTIQQQALEPIDGSRIKFGTVTEKNIKQTLLTDVNATRYYIEPVNGTSIKNSAGTLTIRAVQVDGSGSTVLTAGRIKMFKPDGTLAGNGYTWTADAADINSSIIITLKNESTLVEWDTITLVDITDAGSIVVGAVSASNGLASTRDINGGAWTPVSPTTDLTANFYALGSLIATRTVRVTRNDTDGTLTAALESSSGEPTTHSVVGSGTTSITITFEHTASLASVIEGVITVQGGNNGLDGAGGTNSATLTAFKRSVSEPTDDPGTLTYTFASGDWTPGNGWSKTVPAGSDPLYAVVASAIGTGPTDEVNTAEWSSPVILAQDGSDGAAGLNSATVYLYQRNNSATVAPPLPTTASATYTFADGSLDPVNNGWTRVLPTSGDPYLWFTFATAASTGATDEIASSEWAVAELQASDGEDGIDGNSVFFASVYKRSATPPTEPADNDGQYDFATRILTPPAGWSITIPAPDGNPLYVSNGIFEAVVGGVDGTVDWTAPAQLVSDGAPGTSGNSVFFASVYLRKATAPTKPVDNDGSYNFATETLTAPSIGGGSADNWSISPPASNGNPLYVSNAIFEAAIGGTDNTCVWTSPAVLVTDGTDGTDGIPGMPSFNHVTTADDCDTNATSTSAGKYIFQQTATTTSGTFDWALLTDTGDVLYLVVPNLSGDSSSNYLPYYYQVQVDDVVTWYDSDRRWLSFRITSVEGTIDGGFRFGVLLVSFDEADGTGDIPSTDSDVQFRWSRAFTPTPPDEAAEVYLPSWFWSNSYLASGASEQGLRIDSDGYVYGTKPTEGTYTQLYQWLKTGSNSDYQVLMEKTGGLALSAGTLDTWQLCSTDRTYQRTATIGSFQGKLKIRLAASPNTVLAEMSVMLDNTMV